jgi:PEP-CTERM motif
MGKCLSLAGMMFVVALLFVSPAKADSFDTYTLTGNGLSITFTLPATLTPSSVTWNGIIYISNVTGTYNGSAYTFANVGLGATGFAGATNYIATGSSTREVEFVAPGLFTWNADGTVSLNSGVFDLVSGDFRRGGYTLKVVDPPGPGGDSVTTPEPASLLLLGVGGLVCGALRRRKTA